MNGYLLYIYIQKYFGYHEFKGHVSTIYERTPLTGQYNILIKLAAGIRGYKKKFDCVRVRWHIKGQAVARKMRLPIKCQKTRFFQYVSKIALRAISQSLMSIMFLRN